MSDAETRAANEERVRLAKAMVQDAKAEGYDKAAVARMAVWMGRGDALPHIDEAWELFGEQED